MVWFLAIPLVVWGAKKVYDAVTEEDDSGSTTRSALSIAKSKRTKTRKKAVRSIIQEYRDAALGQLQSSLLDADGIQLNMENETPRLDYGGINTKISVLRGVKVSLLGELCDNHYPVENAEIRFSDEKEIVNSVLKNAVTGYGELAGINSEDIYIQSEDPFLKRLRKMRKQYFLDMTSAQKLQL